MVHVVFSFYLLAVIAGAAAIGQTFMIYQRYRKSVIRSYGWFLIALFLILLSFVGRLYGTATALAGDPTLEAIAWMLQAAGGMTFVFSAPYFYHSLLGLPLLRWLRLLFLGLDAVVFLAAVANVAFPSHPAPVVVLVGSLFLMIAYGIVLISFSLASMGDPVLKGALRIFLILTLAFFPLMLIDSLLTYVRLLSMFRLIEGLAQPLYFLTLNCLSIAFAAKYLNRPAFMEKEQLTEYFLDRYQVSRREAEIIQLLLKGEGGKQIADSLFISAKTVENHIYNIYRKLGVGTRVQLYQLVKANELD